MTRQTTTRKKQYLYDTIDDYRQQHSSLVHFLEGHGEEGSPGQTEDHDQEDTEPTGDVPQKAVYVAEDRVGVEERFPL